ncbi:Heterokaryon incompatibility protein 6, OR allele [Cytospora mali]|uniref:Heterokaryon incompatibility protein 6, OR allele n=1 Tax=Cytospora mali TaxID=578113 RepID=A0A194VE71_CYTMA|nr:Heterokaryon incompatibility protein 6, OR allele [Valsa mali var. pyri (nom. inval.)]
MDISMYIPLLQDRELRLIDIYPGHFADPIRALMYHAVLSEADGQPFEALSYVWGSTLEPVKMFVEVQPPDGHVREHEFFIGQNLAAALRHLRNVDSPRIIWADALCINQQDYDERAKQVLMMGDIYRLTCRVVAFLGPERDDSDHALSFIEHIGGKVYVDFATGITSPADSNEPDWADMR